VLEASCADADTARPNDRSTGIDTRRHFIAVSGAASKSPCTCDEGRTTGYACVSLRVMRRGGETTPGQPLATTVGWDGRHRLLGFCSNPISERRPL
jgi:hypothetical protein